MRTLFLALALAACGGGATKPAPQAPASTTDDVANCTGDVEDSAPGNHDRVVKMDEATEMYGYADKAGAWVIQPRFNHAYEFRKGGIAAVIDNGQFAFIDTSGTAIARAYAFDNGPDYFQAGFARIVDDNNKVGYIADDGRIAIAPQFDAGEPFCAGKAEVQLGGETFTIDVTGARVK